MSTNKTTNYGLHQWQPGDRFMLEEINENAALLDDAIVLGSYVGTGDNMVGQEITLGFRPRAVLVECQHGLRNENANSVGHGGLFLRGRPEYTRGAEEQGQITATGFHVARYMNASPRSFYYIALR